MVYRRDFPSSLQRVLIEDTADVLIDGLRVLQGTEENLQLLEVFFMAIKPTNAQRGVAEKREKYTKELPGIQILVPTIYTEEFP